MNVLVLSGSPKGKNSVTLQSAIYLSKYFNNDSFEILDVGAKIKLLQKDFSDVKHMISNADAILICYPVYTCLATSQLHIFFELMQKNNVDFMDKFVCQYTTSKHFYDMTAHRAVEQIVCDLNGKYVAGLSQDMNDLTTEKGRRQLVDFWKMFIDCINKNIFSKHVFGSELSDNTFDYTDISHNEKNAKTVAIVTNAKDDDITLKNMIDVFRNSAPFNTVVYNIADMNIKGGCLGCLNCASTGECIYKDGFPNLLRNEIESKDGFIYAFTPRLHTMGADFKMFDDRRFCNGHRSMSIGKPCAFISGANLNNDPNLYELLEARAEIAENFMCGIITPIDGMTGLNNVVYKMDYALKTGITLPQNFYGVGGKLIFRDLIYIMQGIMRADYRFYKAKGFFDDMPHKQKGTMRLMKLAGWALNNKAIKAKMGSKMDEGMLVGHKKALGKIDEDRLKFDK